MKRVQLATGLMILAYCLSGKAVSTGDIPLRSAYNAMLNGHSVGSKDFRACDAKGWPLTDNCKVTALAVVRAMQQVLAKDRKGDLQ